MNILRRHGIEPASERGKRTWSRTLRGYSTHYLRERNHQGVGNQLLKLSNLISLSNGPVQRGERLGGMLSF